MYIRRLLRESSVWEMKPTSLLPSFSSFSSFRNLEIIWFMRTQFPWTRSSQILPESPTLLMKYASQHATLASPNVRIPSGRRWFRPGQPQALPMHHHYASSSIMTHHHASLWITMMHYDASSWCISIIMMHHDASLCITMMHLDSQNHLERPSSTKSSFSEESAAEAVA